MTISDLGDIGAFLSGILVPLSLIYLAWQVDHSRKAFDLSRMTTMVSNVSHCTSRYDSIMCDLAKVTNEEEAKAWWYRYWNLFSEEYFFAQKGFIDRDIFELWMMELTNVYNFPPIASHKFKFKTRAEAHNDYLRKIMPDNREVTTFFKALQDCAKIKEPSKRADGVKELVYDRMLPPPPMWKRRA